MQKSEISPSLFTLVEQKSVLERRGFLVLQYISFKEFIINFIYWYVVITFLYDIFYISLGGIISWIVLRNIFFAILLLGFCILIFSIKEYIFSSKIFITERWSIGFGSNKIDASFIYDKKQKILIFLKIYTLLRDKIRVMSNKDWKTDWTGWIISWLFFLFAISGVGTILSFLPKEYLVWYILLPICILSTTVYVLNFLVNIFHPLYAFWNLWSKIQSLTPRISESSDKIQKEFSTDMNFSVLSEWFATLASDFSKISGYVLKLEQIEKKANKWNLFDSEKYISSLREDILTPLISLKRFLEQKKIEIEASREELKGIQSQRQRVQVQVGWSDTLTGNTELQSKRTEPLINELTENIEKLGIMIEKFGKV